MRAKEFLREGDQIVDATFIQNLVRGIHRRLHDFEEGDLVDRIYWFSQYKLVELPISNIDLDEWDLDDDLVTDHVAEIVRSKHTMPPIVFDPISKSIIDGTHRANAYHKLGMKTIPAYVGTVKSSDYGQTSDYENESISESSGETISLEQLYQGDYPDRDEEFWDHVRPSDFKTQMPIQTMQRHMVMITMLGMYQAEHIDEVVDMLEPEQLEVVQAYENDPDLSNNIVLVCDNRIIDGNHRALAAALKGAPIKYVELTEDEIDEEVNPDVRPGFKHIQQMGDDKHLVAEEDIKISRNQRAKDWINKVYELYPGTWQNNHVMTWGEGENQHFCMFELVPSFSKKDAVEVKWFQAYPLRGGVGSRGMQELQRLAKEDGISLTLFPWDKGQVSQAALTRFYKKQGYKPIAKGGRSMYWTPEIDEALS